MGTASRRRRPAASVSDHLSAAADEQRRCQSFPDELEFVPLLLRRGDGGNGALDELPAAPSTQRRVGRGRQQGTPSAKALARRVRWHEMAFGSVRVPAAMDMREIRLRRLRAPRRDVDDEPPAEAGWAPWRLIRSLSCRGVEAVAVAAASAPVRLA